MRQFVLLCAALLMLSIGGCQVAGRAVQSAAMTDKLAGTWTFHGSGDFQLRLEADGTFRASLWGTRASGQWAYSKPFLVLTGTDRQERMSLEGWDMESQPNWIELGSNGSTVRLTRGFRQTSGTPQQAQGTPTSQLPPIPPLRVPPPGSWSSPPATYAPIRCSVCGGSGRVKCYSCGGTGSVQRWKSSSTDPMGDYTTETCSSCGGLGTTTCSACGGTGRL